MDYSQLSTDDLKALQGGDISKVSSAGLQSMQQGHLADAQAADRAKYTPSNGFVDDVLSGAGRGMTSVGRALGLGGVASSFGLPGTKAEADQTDAPLLATTGGKIGNVVGNMAMAAPAVLVPGANTVAGASALGALFGGATTEGDLSERATGAGLGALGGAGGNLLGKGLAAGASKLADMRTARIAAQSIAVGGKPAAAQAAGAAGYVLPPTEVNPSMLNSVLEGFSGKIKTSQSASQTNQATTNKLAQQALGLPTDRQITREALKDIRSTAGKDYNALASTGTVTPPESYGSALDSIVSPYTQAARSFPGSPASPVIEQINALRTPQFDAGDALSKISTLRDAADTAYGQQNKTLGKSLKSAAGALEDALDSHVSTLKNAADQFESSGAAAPGTFPDYGNMLDNFRSARQRIAQTYNVEKALNSETGDVSASVLAAQLKRGAPLSGNLATIAQAGTAFPKATQTLKQNYNALSPLDFIGPAIGAMGEMGVGGSPSMAALAAAGVAARPMARAAILSPRYQRFTTPNAPSATNRLLDMLDSNPTQRLSQIGGMAARPDEVTMPTTTIRGSTN